MKTKQDLKKVFENGDKPKQEDFWDLIESYFHRDEPVTLEELSLLKSNLATVDKTNNGTETLGNVDTKEQVNAKINSAIDALKANAPETYDTLKEIADYIANDSNAEAALLQLINTKLDKPTMTNNYYGLWDDTNKKFKDGNLYNTDLGYVKTDTAFIVDMPTSNNASNLGLISRYSGKGHYNGGLATLDEDGQIVDTIIDYSGFERHLLLNDSMILNSYNRNFSLLPFHSEILETSNLSFNLNESITPKSNSLFVKRDGSSLFWQDKNSSEHSIAFIEDIQNVNTLSMLKEIQFGYFEYNNGVDDIRKPKYKRTFIINGGSGSFDIVSLEIDKLLSLGGVFTHTTMTNSFSLTIPCYDTDFSTVGRIIRCWADDDFGNIHYVAKTFNPTNMSSIVDISGEYVITIEYTKTTDSEELI